MMMTTGHTHFYTEIKQFIRARLPSWRGRGAHPLLLLSSACSISNIRPPGGAHIATILVKISITSRNTAKMLHPLQTKFPLEERGGITLCMHVCMHGIPLLPSGNTDPICYFFDNRTLQFINLYTKTQHVSAAQRTSWQARKSNQNKQNVLVGKPLRWMFQTIMLRVQHQRATC